MKITCPHCEYAKEVDPARIPGRAVRVKCPKCQQDFPVDKMLLPGNVPITPTVVPIERIACPACGFEQETGASCRECGVIYAKFKARRADSVQPPGVEEIMKANSNELRNSAKVVDAGQLPKAGFWMRVVATLIDSFLLCTVQLVLGFLIGLIIGSMGILVDGDPALNMVLWLFGTTLSIGFAVFFTGYCGQTPGKMALRIKVIRTDGSPMTYGRAALREVLGKFVSSILLGIGYLMVAFDSQKQGLHDKIADTYVIKL